MPSGKVFNKLQLYVKLVVARIPLSPPFWRAFVTWAIPSEFAGISMHDQLLQVNSALPASRILAALISHQIASVIDILTLPLGLCNIRETDPGIW